MKLQLVRLSLILMFLSLALATVWIGINNDLMAPFLELPDRVRLLSHINYVAIFAGFIFASYAIPVLVYQLLHPDRDRFSYGKIWNGLIYTVVIVSVIAFGSRLYLGHRVDQAHYVKCPKESRTSAKSSWRVYAKSSDLCKDSSGIAGG